MNKVIMGILIFLIVISGGLGYYACALNQQIDSLGRQMAALQAERRSQTDAIGELDSNLTGLSGEIQSKLGVLDSEIKGNLGQIGSLAAGIDRNLARAEVLGERVDSNLAEIEALQGEMGVTALFSQVVIDAEEVYQSAHQATVRISNGERTFGSGFIFDQDGHVLTAHHVVENISQVYIILPDGRVTAATKAGSDAISDVAVLIPEERFDIVPLTLGDSADLQVGAPVAAIGSPFDLTESLTTGIISQLDRFTDITAGTQTRTVANLIQFDAAVNSGNSGCPLFDAEGEVIGLVIARVQPEDGDGIYYAVSANKMKRVAASLLAQGSFDYPWLGVGIADLTPQMVESLDLETVNGVLVITIANDGPAEAAGMAADDIIIAMDGRAMRDLNALTSYLGEYKSPGDTAAMTVMRDGVERELSLEIGQRPQ
jgi:S1-C subfamily serine protease